MSISATRSDPQLIESLLKFRIRPKIIDAKSIATLSDDDVVTVGPVKDLKNDIKAVADKIPAAPTQDGTYLLTCTVTDGAAVYEWEEKE